MVQSISSESGHAALLAERLVRYRDLRPCTTAFIDTRTPGSTEKENFTIIGPGVAENPDQYVHIDIPHGFNIGGARQPPGCVNSQHSHETAEVFIIQSGHRAFYTGVDCGDGEVTVGPGDTISIPIHVFRGFENVGDDVGYMFAVLGGDDPGMVTWAPYVFDQAAEHGLILLEDGSLVDTSRGAKIPDSKRAMRPTSEEDVARLDRLTTERLGDCIVRRRELLGVPDEDPEPVRELPIIGSAGGADGLGAGKIDWPHGFNLRLFTALPGAETALHSRREEEVILMHKGALNVSLGDDSVELGPGDVLTIPVGMRRRFGNFGDERVEAYVVRGGDDPQPPALMISSLDHRAAGDGNRTNAAD